MTPMTLLGYDPLAVQAVSEYTFQVLSPSPIIEPCNFKVAQSGSADVACMETISRPSRIQVWGWEQGLTANPSLAKISNFRAG